MAVPVSMGNKPAYTYNATVLRWVDGDTVEMAIDVGFYLTATVRVRVLGCDTPERGHPLHDRAWARSRELAAEGSRIVVTTMKEADKYGRWLCSIPVALAGAETDVASILIAEGLAHPYDGGTKSAW